MELRSEVLLHGGLGNQLFQYAFGFYIQTLSSGKRVIFNRSFFNSENHRYPRKFILQAFLPEDYFGQSLEHEIYPNLVSRLYNRISSAKSIKSCFPLFILLLYNLNTRFGNQIIEDFDRGFCPLLLKRFKNRRLNDGNSFKGYWSDVRYFEPILIELRENLFLRSPSHAFLALKARIEESDIMMHIRRGDYLSIGTSKEGIFLGLDYYERALEQFSLINGGSIKQKVWVFSDDYEWCKMVFPEKWPNLDFSFEADNLSDEESFELMRNFRFMVLANSTYSLWAHYISYQRDLHIVLPNSYIQSLELKGYQLKLNNAFVKYNQI